MLRRWTLLFVLAIAACAPQTAAPPSNQVQPAQSTFPRTVETASGPVTIDQPPRHIHALSLGIEEISLALLPADRFAAVSTLALDPAFSNSVELANMVPKRVGRDAEQVLAAEPDLVVATPTVRKELVDRLRAARVPVLVVPWAESLETLPKTIRWLGVIYGTDAAAERLVSEVETRLARIDAIVAKTPEANRPTVVLMAPGNSTPGKGASVDVLLRRAGARNLSYENAIEGYKPLSLESLIAWKPSIIIAQEEPTNPAFAITLRSNPALADVPAVKDNKVIVVPGRILSTLSHYQVRGVEELAKLLYPDALGTTSFLDFTRP